MVNPVNLRWNVITPIIYSDYLSETEVLNALTAKVNELVDVVNRIDDESMKESIAELQNSVASINSSVSTLQNVLNMTNSKLDTLSNNVDRVEIELDARIDETQIEVSALDKRLTSAIENLENELVSLTEYIDSRYDTLDVKIAAVERRIYSIVSTKISNVLKIVQQMIDSIGNVIDVINPVSGKQDTLQNTLNSMYDYLDGGITCIEFNRLSMTCEQFNALGLTCYDFRTLPLCYYLNILHPDNTYDLYGNIVDNPVSSVYNALGYGVSVDVCDVDCNTFKQYSNKYGAQKIDAYGDIILSGLYNSYVDRYIILQSENTYTPDSDVTQVIMPLSILIPDEYTEVDISRAYVDKAIVSIDYDFDISVMSETGIIHASVVSVSGDGVVVKITDTAKTEDGTRVPISVHVKAIVSL